MDLCTLTFGQLARTRAQHERGPNVQLYPVTPGPVRVHSTQRAIHAPVIAPHARRMHSIACSSYLIASFQRIFGLVCARKKSHRACSGHPKHCIPTSTFHPSPDDEEPRAAMLRRCRKCLGNGIGEVRPTAAEVRWHFGRCSATLLLHRQQLPRCRDPMMDLPSRTRSASPNARLARQQARQRLRCSCRRRLR